MNINIAREHSYKKLVIILKSKQSLQQTIIRTTRTVSLPYPYAVSSRTATPSSQRLLSPPTSDVTCTCNECAAVNLPLEASLLADCFHSNVIDVILYSLASTNNNNIQLHTVSIPSLLPSKKKNHDGRLEILWHVHISQWVWDEETRHDATARL